jgi:hypothetical protein
MASSSRQLEADVLDEAPLCIVRRSLGMQDLERRLQFAMVAYVGGGRGPVPPELVQEALVCQMGLPGEGFSVHLYQPEDFLIVFANAELRNRVSACSELSHDGVQFFFRKWTRQSQASLECWRSKVHLVLEGVPPHAWDKEVV